MLRAALVDMLKTLLASFQPEMKIPSIYVMGLTFLEFQLQKNAQKT